MDAATAKGKKASRADRLAKAYAIVLDVQMEIEEWADSDAENLKNSGKAVLVDRIVEQLEEAASAIDSVHLTLLGHADLF